MSLKEVEWKARYTPEEGDDIKTDFFIPVLTHSKYYYRVSGYFSAGLFRSVARGLSEFIERGERIKLIVGPKLKECDIEAINKGSVEPAALIERRLFERWSDIEEALKKEYLEVFAWLISKGKLQLKVGLKKNEAGEAVSSEEGQFHQKFAVFEDEQGNRISIEGSLNESKKALEKNEESFDVNISWGSNRDKERVKSCMNEFKRKWEDDSMETRTFSFPEAVEKEIVEKYKPDSPPEIDYKNEIEGVSYDDLWDPQKDAVDSWAENDYRGIFKMATGSGKTWAALVSIKRLTGSFVTLLFLPTNVLIEQWEREILEVFGEENASIIKCSSNYRGWENKLGHFLASSARNRFVLTTFKSGQKEKFYQKINSNLGENEIVFVADEVHGIGSKERKKILDKINAKKGRLGLSATPKRFNDPRGNRAIEDYFSGPEKTIVKEYGIKKALGEVLTPYKYKIHFVSLDKGELEDYKGLTRTINGIYNKLESKYKSEDLSLEEIFYRDFDDPLLNRFSQKCISRAQILKKCTEKREALRKILPNNSKTLIYCEDNEQLEEVSQLLFDQGLPPVKYTSDSIDNPEEGEETLRRIKDGENNILLAIRCLDEGIDLPDIDTAIILSSTSNPRQWIQRRGRVLRNSEKKDIAIIHDFFVLPYTKDELTQKELNRSEKKLIKKELDRIKTFQEDAENSGEAFNQMVQIKRALRA